MMVEDSLSNTTSTYSFYTDINTLAEIVNNPVELLSYLPLLSTENHESNLASLEHIYMKPNLSLFATVRILINTTNAVDQYNVVDSILSIDFQNEMLDERNCILLDKSCTRVIEFTELTSNDFEVFQPCRLVDMMLTSRIKYSTKTNKIAFHNIKSFKRLVSNIRSMNINIGLIPKSELGDSFSISILRILSKASFRSIKLRNFTKPFVVPRYILKQYKISLPPKYSAKPVLNNLTIYKIVNGILTRSDIEYSETDGYIDNNTTDSGNNSSNNSSGRAIDIPSKTTDVRKVDNVGSSLGQSIKQNNRYVTQVLPIEKVYTDTSVPPKVSLNDLVIESGEQLYNSLVANIDKFSRDTYSQFITEAVKNINNLNKKFTKGELDRDTYHNFFVKYRQSYDDLMEKKRSAFVHNANTLKQFLSNQSIQLGATRSQIYQLIGDTKSELRDNFIYAMQFFPTSWIQEVIDVQKGEKLILRKLSEGKRGKFKSTKNAISATANKFETIIHEFCHYLEKVVANILKLEKDYYIRRTHHSEVRNYKGYRRDELFRDSDFVIPYMNKLYDYNAFEVLSTGYTSLFVQPDELLKDKELVSWLFGLIKLVGNKSGKINQSLYDESDKLDTISFDVAVRPFKTVTHVYNSIVKTIVASLNYLGKDNNLSKITIGENQLDLTVQNGFTSRDYTLLLTNDPLYVFLKNSNAQLILLADFINELVDGDIHSSRINGEYLEIFYKSIERDLFDGFKKYLFNTGDFNSPSVYEFYNSFINRASRFIGYYDEVDYDDRYNEFVFTYIIQIDSNCVLNLSLKPRSLKEPFEILEFTYNANRYSEYDSKKYSVSKSAIIDYVRLMLPH